MFDEYRFCSTGTLCTETGSRSSSSFLGVKERKTNRFPSITQLNGNKYFLRYSTTTRSLGLISNEHAFEILRAFARLNDASFEVRSLVDLELFLKFD